MKIALISFRLERPEGVNDDEFLEWMRYELGLSGNISMENPMEYAELRDEIKNPVIKMG